MQVHVCFGWDLSIFPRDHQVSHIAVRLVILVPSSTNQGDHLCLFLAVWIWLGRFFTSPWLTLCSWAKASQGVETLVHGTHGPPWAESNPAMATTQRGLALILIKEGSVIGNSCFCSMSWGWYVTKRSFHRVNRMIPPFFCEPLYCVVLMYPFILTPSAHSSCPPTPLITHHSTHWPHPFPSLSFRSYSTLYLSSLPPSVLACQIPYALCLWVSAEMLLSLWNFPRPRSSAIGSSLVYPYLRVRREHLLHSLEMTFMWTVCTSVSWAYWLG